jgi:hypothetical protein
LSFEFGRSHFDFSTIQAPIQNTSAKEYAIYFGVTRDWKYFTTSALVGISTFRFDPHLTEIIDGKPFPHAGNPSNDYLVFKGSIGKKFGLTDRLAVIPELSVKVYGKQPGFQRCRTFLMNRVAPTVGIRLQF